MNAMITSQKLSIYVRLKAFIRSILQHAKHRKSNNHAISKPVLLIPLLEPYRTGFFIYRYCIREVDNTGMEEKTHNAAKS